MQFRSHLIVCLLALVGHSQAQNQKLYQMSIDREHAVLVPRTINGKSAYYYTVPFQIRLTSDPTRIVTDVPKTEIVIKEDGQRVTSFELFQPKISKLTTVLAIDISGSMGRSTGRGSQTKMQEAQGAARLFLAKLDQRASTGLILFDHLLRDEIAPLDEKDQKKLREARAKIQKAINAARPQGGTAYLNATHRAVELLKEISGRKAIVLLTDGVDVDSNRTMNEVVEAARSAEIPVYTIGVGEPQKKEDVTTVLVLDKSGSMAERVREGVVETKMDALKVSAKRFVRLMGPKAQSTVIPFSNDVGTPEEFTTNHEDLKARIEELEALGGTRLYDATRDGIETVLASKRSGKKYVVVLTDGKDTGSLIRKEDVIQRAVSAEVPLFMLGFGDKDRINEEAMKEMAQKTGGMYFHAEDQKSLVKVFETVSSLLHGDVDEAALRHLAKSTGGKYHQAKNAHQLEVIYQQLANELQNTYTVTFPSRYKQGDGSLQGIDIYVERDGKQISDVGKVDLSRHGLVVAEMHYPTYLLLLVLLVGLLALPTALKKKSSPT